MSDETAAPAPRRPRAPARLARGGRGGGERGGEQITLQAMIVAALFLARAMDDEVPAQDLEIPADRVPPRPRSGSVLRRERALAADVEPRAPVSRADAVIPATA